MELYKYKSYEHYKQEQTDANIRKIETVWVDENSLIEVLNYIDDKLLVKPKFILCHGTRRGEEQRIIKNYYDFKGLKVEVLGTEISHTAKDFENTIQWDFHETKQSWINNTDIIYSNSFDHSYKPKECLDIWMSCLNENGVCILEYSTHSDHKSNSTDPFGASYEEYIELISKKYEIVHVINNKNIPESNLPVLQGKRHYFIIKKK